MQKEREKEERKERERVRERERERRKVSEAINFVLFLLLCFLPSCLPRSTLFGAKEFNLHFCYWCCLGIEGFPDEWTDEASFEQKRNRWYNISRETFDPRLETVSIDIFGARVVLWVSMAGSGTQNPGFDSSCSSLDQIIGCGGVWVSMVAEVTQNPGFGAGAVISLLRLKAVSIK